MPVESSPLVDSKPAASTGELLGVLCSLWTGGLLTNLVKVWPAVYSTDLQSKLGLTNSEVSLLFSIPPLVACIWFLVAPALLATLGIRKLLIMSNAGVVIFQTLTAVGLHIESYALLAPSTCMALSLTALSSFASRQIIVASVSKTAYAQWAALGTAIMTLGYTLAHLVMAPIGVEVGLWVTVGLTGLILPVYVLGERLGYALAHKGEPNSTNGQAEPHSMGLKIICTAVTAELKKKVSWAELRSFPKMYWLVAIFGAFVSAFGALGDVAANIFTRVHDVPAVDANRMASLMSIVAIVVGPPAGWLYSHAGDRMCCSLVAPSHGSMFMIGSVILFFAQLIPALFWKVWIGYYEMCLLGAGVAIIGSGAGGLIPYALEDDPSKIAAGFAWSSIVGQIFFTAVTQICFHTFGGGWMVFSDPFVITPSQFTFVFFAVVVFVLAIVYSQVEAARELDKQAGKEGKLVAMHKEVPDEGATWTAVGLEQLVESLWPTVLTRTLDEMSERIADLKALSTARRK